MSVNEVPPNFGLTSDADDIHDQIRPDKSSSATKELGVQDSAKQKRLESDSETALKSDSETSMQCLKKKQASDDAHNLTFTVTVAKAIPLIHDHAAHSDQRSQKNKKSVHVPRAQFYYHTEYYMLQTDNEPVKTDIVSYGFAAKVYPDRQEPKVVKTWEQGDKTWIAWSHSHVIQVTTDLLKNLHQHTLQLRIWDTKDKCSPRAKFDRPKTFRLPQSKGDLAEESSVRGLVLQQAQSFADSQGRWSYIERPLPTETPIESASPSPPPSRLGSDKRSNSASTPTPNSLISVPNNEGLAAEDSRSYSRLGKLAGITQPVEDKAKSKSTRSKSRQKREPSPEDSSHGKRSCDRRPLSGKGLNASSTSGTRHRKTAEGFNTAEEVQDPSQTKKSRKNDTAAQLRTEHIKKHGLASVHICMAEFYSGRTSITTRLEKSVASIEDLFLTVSIDGSLLSDEQLKTLNPLIFTVEKLSDLPNTPLSYENLIQQCQPVTCQFKLFQQPTLYKTIARRHDANIYFNDVRVFLLGDMDRNVLHEYLTGPLLEVEVHDRDRKPSEEKLQPTLFGLDLDDEKISNVGLVTSRRTTHNPFTDRDKHWDPYGVARFDLSGLLRGQRMISAEVAVQPCPLPDVVDTDVNVGTNQFKLVGVAGAVDGPADPPLLGGDYLQSETTVKIRVDLAVSLVSDSISEDSPQNPKCPFGRLVVVFDYQNTSFMTLIQSLVLSVNGRALNLDTIPPHITRLALATYRLSRVQQESRTLDIVTGFQVMDGRRHIVVLEGLHNLALREFRKELHNGKAPDVRIFYNTDLRFSERIYATLDVDMAKIKLHEPLDSIVQRSLLYVRDIVPKPCFQAVIKLHSLLYMEKLRDIVRNDLFPNVEMIQSLSKEFGVPISSEEFEELVPKTENEAAASGHEITTSNPYQLLKRRKQSVLDDFNNDFIRYLQHRDEVGPQTNYITANKAAVKDLSADIHKKRMHEIKPTISASVDEAHNYSIQTLNSVELAKDKLRELLRSHPNRLYTYCPTYHHSMAVVPVNESAVQKQEAQEARRKWKTAVGWQYPGMKPSINSNRHPLKPNAARIDELNQPWQENELHRCILEPTLDRDRYPWTRRRDDMNIWSRPGELFDPNQSVSVLQAGNQLEQERLAAAVRDYEAWKQKICVNNLDVKCHRCLPATEMTARGRNASNQLTRLEDVLKDPADKYGIRSHGLHRCPPLNVVHNPSVDTLGRKMGRMFPDLPSSENNKGFGPGPFPEHLWIMGRNHIPLPNYEHKTFTDTKGHDFNIYHKARSPLSGRREHQRPLSRQLDTDDQCRIPRPESYHYQDDLAYQTPAALSFITQQLQRAVPQPTES